jgi:hypothetical protein
MPTPKQLDRYRSRSFDDLVGADEQSDIVRNANGQHGSLIEVRGARAATKFANIDTRPPCDPPAVVRERVTAASDGERIVRPASR